MKLAGGDAFIQGGANHQSSTTNYVTTIGEQELGPNAGFTTADFSAGYSYGNFTYQAFIQNAFDEHGVLSKNTVCVVSVCGPYARDYPTKPQFFRRQVRAAILVTAGRGNPGASAPAEKDAPDPWRALADRLAREGNLAAADRAYLKHVAAAQTNPTLMQAGNALVRNDLAVAERILKPFLQQNPTDVAGIRMLAEVAGRIGRYEDAENLLRRVLELCPSFAAARFNLAIVLHRQHRSTEAAAEVEALLNEDPDSTAYRNLHGAVLSRLGNYEDAAGQFERVLKNRPGDPHLWMNYGHALKTIGRRDESIAAYRRCIGLRRNLGEAWWSLANLKSRVLTAADIHAMDEILAGGDLSAADRLHLHFALGAAHEDREAWAASFDHYSKGNAVRRSQIWYDAAETWGIATRTSAFMSSHGFRDLLGAGCDSRAPIFIVGMPRSGSTLVEQILASHSLIEGTKELAEVSLLAGSIVKKRTAEVRDSIRAQSDCWSVPISGHSENPTYAAASCTGRPIGHSSSTRCRTTGYT